jgi:threonine dehydrogenase-like Zn-dependent dehydrogenase
MRDQQVTVGELPDPTPGPGEVLVRTLSCGLCASDLHVLHHGEELVRWSHEYGGPFSMDLGREVVLGHEYCAEIVDHGPRTSRKLKPGTRVTSTPAVFHAGGVSAIGFSNEYPGGFGEYMLLSEDLVRAVPVSLDTKLAALSEPVSVGIYYVRAARLEQHDVPLVIGCGAIGLAVIARGSPPGRRKTHHRGGLLRLEATSGRVHGGCRRRQSGGGVSLQELDGGSTA